MFSYGPKGCYPYVENHCLRGLGATVDESGEGLRSREQKLLSSVARFLLLSEKELEMTQNKELRRRFWQTE